MKNNWLQEFNKHAGMQVQCCMCGKVRNEQGVFVPAPSSGQLGKEQVSHGYCPDCYQTALEEVEDM